MSHPTSRADTMLIQPPEIVAVPLDTDEVSCDGGNGPLGHPLVYYSFDGRQDVECAYCDRRFVKGVIESRASHDVTPQA